MDSVYEIQDTGDIKPCYKQAISSCNYYLWIAIEFLSDFWERSKHLWHTSILFQFQRLIKWSGSSHCNELFPEETQYFTHKYLCTSELREIYLYEGKLMVQVEWLNKRYSGRLGKLILLFCSPEYITLAN